jgi:hypothetical protein
LLWHAAAEQLVNGSKQGITVRSAVCRRDEGAGRGRHVTLARRVDACHADHRRAIFKHAPRTAEQCKVYFVIERRCNVIERRGNVIERRCNVIERRCNVIERRGNVIERRCNVIERRGNVTERRGNVIERRGNVTERRGNVTERRGNVIERRGNVFRRVEGEGWLRTIHPGAAILPTIVQVRLHIP